MRISYKLGHDRQNGFPSALIFFKIRDIWKKLDFYLFQYARIDMVNKGRVNARRWPGAVAVMAINSSPAPAFRQRRPAFRVDYVTYSVLKLDNLSLTICLL